MSDTNVTLNMDGAERLRAALPRIVRTALLSAALIPQNDAKRRAPVVTGTLRRSIHIGGYNYQGGGEQLPGPQEHGDTMTVIVGTNLEYAPIVELGSANGRRRPKPYLVPALENNRSAIQKEFTEVAGKMIEAIG